MDLIAKYNIELDLINLSLIILLLLLVLHTIMNLDRYYKT